MTDETPAGGGGARPRPLQQRPGPPPRPPLGSDLAPPVPRTAPRPPGTVRAAAWCWAAGCLAGLVALGAAAADLAAVRQRLVDAARAADPGTSEDLLREGADTTVVAVLGPLALLVVLGLIVLLPPLRRCRAWRVALLVLAVLTVVVDVVAQDLLRGGPELDRAAAVAQGALALATLVLLLLRPSRGRPRG